MRLLQALTLLVGGSMTVAADVPRQSGPVAEDAVTINGATNPELIPDHLLWEAGFRALVRAGHQGQERVPPERYESLSRYELHIPPDDVRLVIEHAEQTVERLRELAKPLDDAHAGRVQLGWTSEERRLHAARRIETVLAARETLARKLTPASFKAVTRWIAEGAAGMVVSFPGKR